MPASLLSPVDQRRNLWLNEDVYAATLLVLFIDTYGTEGLEWHPSTIKMQVEADFNVQLSKQTFDRLMAGITLVTTNYFYRNLPKFIDLCNILSGDDFDPGVFDPADSAECAWGITEALIINPDPDEEFADDIRHYITQVLLSEGYVTPPDVLRIAIDADFTNRVKYNFSDDPEMFQGIYAVQQQKTGEITDMIRRQLGELLAQIQSLPLNNGQTDELIKRIRESGRSQSSR